MRVCLRELAGSGEEVMGRWHIGGWGMCKVGGRDWGVAGPMDVAVKVGLPSSFPSPLSPPITIARLLFMVSLRDVSMGKAVCVCVCVCV